MKVIFVIISALVEPTVEVENVTTEVPVIAEVIVPADKRPSAIVMGSFALIMMCCMLGVLVLMDLPSLK